MTNLNEKLAPLFANPDFTAEAKSVKTIEEMQQLMARFDVEMSHDEIVEMCRIIAEQMNSTGDELCEEALDNVAGGVWGWVVVGIVCVGAFALGVWNGYHD